jgi:hypothetical protein
MAMVHPFEKWSTSAEVATLVACAVVFLIASRVFRSIGRALRTNGGGSIVGLELVGSTAAASRLLGRWRAHGHVATRAARRSLLLDVPFLAAYGLGLAVVGAVAAESARRHGWTAAADATALAAWVALVAAALDAAEDVALVFVLRQSDRAVVRQPAPRVAQLCAAAKFVSLVLAIPLLVGTALVGTVALIGAEFV